jgi:copper chaperone CopZ
MLVGLLAVCACRQADVRTITIDVPGMKDEAAVQKVVNILARTGGVDGKSIDVDPKKRQVTLRYDSLLLSLKNIEFALAEAGFAANDIPARPESAKPGAEANR